MSSAIAVCKLIGYKIKRYEILDLKKDLGFLM